MMMIVQHRHLQSKKIVSSIFLCQGEKADLSGTKKETINRKENREKTPAESPYHLCTVQVFCAQAKQQIHTKGKTENTEKIQTQTSVGKHLHICRYTLSVTEDLVQVFCAKDVSQTGLG